MVEIIYHPINPQNPFFQSGGVNVSLDEFLRKDHLWRDQNEGSIQCFDVSNPLYSRGTINYMSRAISTISGHLPSPHDMRKIISLLQMIKDGVKRSEYGIRDKITSPQFVLGTLPYLFVGFDMDFNTKVPHESHNTSGSAYNVAKRLCEEGSVELSSSLCAHKNKRSVEPNTLIDSIPFVQVQRVLNVIGGLTDNSPVTSAKHIFYQPAGNFRDLRFVFPPLVHKYYYQGRTDEMLAKLDEHLMSLQRYLSTVQTPKLSFEARDLSVLVNEVEKQIVKLKNGNLGSELLEISEGMTKKGVMRLYGRFEEVVPNQNQKGDPEVERVIHQIISMKDPEVLSQKALYETVLYYSWGLLTGQNNGIGIGLEVDHEKYQTLAWDLGWRRGRETHANNPVVDSPLIFARKNRKVQGHKNLKGLSLRESWR